MIGKVKYIGDSFGVASLTNDKTYSCVEVDYPFLRIIDDSGEDYLYSIKKPCSMKIPNFAVGGLLLRKKGILRQYIE